jgi:hypothetical protein
MNEFRYRATDLEDIAKMFDRHAAAAAVNTQYRTKKGKELAKRESFVWTEAARILRQTKLEADPQ